MNYTEFREITDAQTSFQITEAAMDIWGIAIEFRGQTQSQIRRSAFDRRLERLRTELETTPLQDWLSQSNERLTLELIALGQEIMIVE